MPQLSCIVRVHVGKGIPMSNDFFDNHPILGSAFDFNRDGSLGPGEAGAMAAFGTMAASELMRATEEAEREWDSSSTSKKKKKKKSHYDDYDFDDDFVEYDEDKVFEVDTSDVDEVMNAITSGDFDEADIEYLVHEALCSGVKFDSDDAEEILELIRERDLKNWVKTFLD